MNKLIYPPYFRFFLAAILFYSFTPVLFSQTQVPEQFLKHPEYGKTKLSGPNKQDSYELIQERTIDSRLFQNPDGSFTAVKSGEPMHYKDAEGWWRTIDVTFEEDILKPHLYHLNKQRLPMSFDGKTGAVTMALAPLSQMSYGHDRMLIQTDANGTVISEKNINNFMATVDKQKATASIENVFNGIDMSLIFDFRMAKTDFSINSPSVINAGAEWVIIREKVNIPQGCTLSYDYDNGSDIGGSWQGDVVVKDMAGQILSRFREPIYFDSVSNRNTNYITGSYKIENIGPSTYYLSLMIPVSWLKASDRVYPVTIDPITCVDDPTIIPSCLIPDYNPSNITANIPSGTTITETYFLWEYTAHNNGAEISDQVSYVENYNGPSPLFYGTVQNSGTETYTYLDTLGPVLSTGTAVYTFYTQRLWGGTDCNNQYNYLGRRRTETTYFFPTTITELSEENIIAFYAPTENCIFINNQGNIKLVKIFSLNGQLLKEISPKEPHSDMQIKINAENKQLLFLQIFFENHFIVKKLPVF